MIEGFLKQAQSVMSHFQEELKSLRTGRATPVLVEHLGVHAYGSQMPLKQLASISAPEPQLIVVDPWDKSLLKDVEKAIRESGQGFNPVLDGHIIRIPIPSLTEERRKALIKLLHQKGEETRIAIRGLREDLLKQLKQKKADGEISEDEFFRQEKELQLQVDRANDQIKALSESKEKDILTI